MSLYVYGAMLLALLAALAGAGVYEHHQGYASGQASMQQKLAASTLARDRAVSQSQADDAAVAQVKAQLDANAQAAKAQQQQAQVAVAKAKANAADSDRTLKAWMADYAKALRNPSCTRPVDGILCADLRVY